MVNMSIKHDRVTKKLHFVYWKCGFVFMNYRLVLKKKCVVLVKWCQNPVKCRFVSYNCGKVS